MSSAISLNASVFASVCLASRLSSSLDAFVMVALAVQLFVFFPELRTSLQVSLATRLSLLNFVDYFVRRPIILSLHRSLLSYWLLAVFPWLPW